MKKFVYEKIVSLLLTFGILLGLCACTASPNEGKDPAPSETNVATDPSAPVSDSIEAEPEVPSVEPLELIVPGINYYEDATVGGVSVGGSFYVYGPEHPHTYDMLSSFLNGTIFVYPDAPVEDEADALGLIQSLGFDEIAESFPAYIVIPNPVNGEAWSEADVELYWNVQFWLSGGAISFATGAPQCEYVRHAMQSLLYVFGEGNGATFVNNVLSQNAQRIAGIATFGGEINTEQPTGVAVPAYLVNASEDAVAYWKTANGVDTEENGVFYNSDYAQKKVIIADGNGGFDKASVQNAWEQLLSHSMRLGVSINAVLDTQNRDEWVLMDWPELSEIGLARYAFEWDAETATAEYYDEYLTKSSNTVQLYVPEAVEQNPGEAVPLLVVLHGNSDDPINVVMGCGWAQKAAEENFIVVVPSTEDVEYVMSVIEYIASVYKIDPSRIYATGFSTGGKNAAELGKAHPEVFAAIAPMGYSAGSYVDGADGDNWDLPIVSIVGSIDDRNVGADEDGNFAVNVRENSLEALEQAFEINGIDPGELDFGANPLWGYTPDEYYTIVDKNLEWQVSDFYSDDYEQPVVKFVTIVGVAHSNADYMATIAWDFLENFARAEDGSLIELP